MTKDKDNERLPVQIAANIVNPVLALIWTFAAIKTYGKWAESQSVVALMLFFVNSLFALLFLLRRDSVKETDNPKDWMITAATILLSFSLQVQSQHAVALAAVSQSIQAVAVMLILISLIALGRSFGLIPANRGIKTHSLYSYVRHPLYAGELLYYFGFVLGNVTIFNVAILGCIITGLALRASAEERLLSSDQSYLKYLERVRFRFIPGLY